jgi:hypothetical protein
VRKAGDGFALNGNSVLIDFLMKGLTKSNDIVARNGNRGWFGRIGVEPESHAIKEMKTREINEPGPGWFFLCSKKDRRRENSLKSRDQALIVRPIFGQAKEVEHLGRRIEMDCPVFLLEG